MKTVGIVGFGSFGKFVAERLDKFYRVTVYSPSGRPNKWAASLADVAKADFLILAIPVEAYRPTLTKIKPLIGPDTVTVDVCSVKGELVKIIKTILPEQKMVATHPLFGPESATESLDGRVLVVCPEASDRQAAESIEQFAVEQGVEVIQMSAEPSMTKRWPRCRA